MTTQKILAPMVAALLFAGSNMPAQGETIIRKSVTYFAIGGTTVSDIDREMLQRGPVSSSSGRRHPGATQIKFDGSAKFVKKGGRCVIRGAKVSLSTKLILPRWTNRKKATAQMALIWDTLSADIKRHEERHAEIARIHARALERDILDLPPSRDCKTLKAKVSRISQDAMTAHDKDQHRFDRIETVNFENRMIRLLRHRMAKQPRK
jgi:predicted secreted Zn-dependent protease